MALRDPVAVYNAANNVEAHLVRNVLVTAGIEAFVTEDISQVGTWMLGLIPEIHKPQVWVERADVERVKPILDDYDRRAAELREIPAQQDDLNIEVICEKCEHPSAYPASQLGSVQQCQHCGAYVDVENEESLDDWGDEELAGES